MRGLSRKKNHKEKPNFKALPDVHRVSLKVRAKNAPPFEFCFVFVPRLFFASSSFSVQFSSFVSPLVLNFFLVSSGFCVKCACLRGSYCKFFCFTFATVGFAGELLLRR